MDIAKVVNLTIGCLMASELNLQDKNEAITVLASIEDKIERYEKALNDIKDISMRGSVNEFAYGQLAKEALENE